MRTSFEYEIVQNPALAAVAIHAATLQCFETTNRQSGVPLPLLMLVAPLVFPRDPREVIRVKVLDGSFYKTVADDRTLTVGLQQRMESMAQLSFNAVNLCCSANLLEREQDRFVVRPIRLTALRGSNVDSQMVVAAAKRVGHWFATVRFETLCSLLGIRF
jgi:hypothetical protein